MLCEGLKDNQLLLYLNIAKNDITVDGFESFTEILPTTKIEDLDLHQNPLGNAGMTLLGQAISRYDGYNTVKKQVCSLKRLNVAECSFS